jgi:transmembrane sensor
MTDSYKNRNSKTAPFHAREHLPVGMDGPDRQDMEKIWETSAGTPQRTDRPDDRETEEALESVHHRLALAGADVPQTARIHPIPERASVRRGFFGYPVWITAAAVALIAFGLGYLLYPQSLAAPYGQRVAAALPDGSTVELNSGTTIRYNRLFGIRNRDVQLDGEAFFTVVPGNTPFIVKANQAVVEVTGTSFNVRSRSDDPGLETRVHVASGSVALYPAGQAERSVSLSAGDWSRWKTGMESPSTPEPAPFGDIGEWRENRFHFRSETLGMIFREIERRFDIRIQLEAGQLASEVLSAHYTDPGDPERIIEDICHVKGLRYARTANGFRIYR